LESACALDTAAARSPFAQRVWREATRRGFCQASRKVVLGDGAPWIWNIADDQFPDATQIVDRYHTKQHLSDLGKALYGLTAPRAAPWADRRKIPGATHRHPTPSHSLRCGSSLSPLFPDQPRAYALCGVPRPRLVHFHRRCRGRMQSGHRHAPQTRRDALD
jgi:transposase